MVVSVDSFSHNNASGERQADSKQVSKQGVCPGRTRAALGVQPEAFLVLTVAEENDPTKSGRWED